MQIEGILYQTLVFTHSLFNQIIILHKFAYGVFVISTNLSHYGWKSVTTMRFKRIKSISILWRVSWNQVIAFTMEFQKSKFFESKIENRLEKVEKYLKYLYIYIKYEAKSFTRNSFNTKNVKYKNHFSLIRKYIFLYIIWHTNAF